MGTIGAGRTEDLTALVINSTGFSATYSGVPYTWTWTKDGNGRITQLESDGRTIPVTWS